MITLPAHNRFCPVLLVYDRFKQAVCFVVFRAQMTAVRQKWQFWYLNGLEVSSVALIRIWREAPMWALRHINNIRNMSRFKAPQAIEILSPSWLGSPFARKPIKRRAIISLFRWPSANGPFWGLRHQNRFVWTSCWPPAGEPYYTCSICKALNVNLPVRTYTVNEPIFLDSVMFWGANHMVSLHRQIHDCWREPHRHTQSCFSKKDKWLRCALHASWALRNTVFISLATKPRGSLLPFRWAGLSTRGPFWGLQSPEWPHGVLVPDFGRPDRQNVCHLCFEKQVL